MSLTEPAAARTIEEAAPAKINLALHVTGLRPDGYHSLESLAVFCAFGDAVGVAHASADSFVAEGPFAGDVPADDGNLVLKARNAARSFASARGGSAGDVSVSITLRKRLPVASGLGGGSSDAAATLRALGRLWGLGLPGGRLAVLSEALGADVPMCVHARPLIARGVGEAIEPLPGFPAFALVLVNPGVPVSTPAVFKALAHKRNDPLPHLPATLTPCGLLDWLNETRNDLQAPAEGLAPAVARAVAALADAGAGFARMSGSGATCFGLFGSDEEAGRAAAAIRVAHPAWWVQATRTLPSAISSAG